jgi:hypothetical protein
VAALLLVGMGKTPGWAVEQVREARPGAIETREQERYVLSRAAGDAQNKDRAMDWFEKLTGFREEDYASTRARLAVEGQRLHSLANGASYGVGTFELAAVEDLRQRARARSLPGRIRVAIARGDARKMTPTCAW